MKWQWKYSSPSSSSFSCGDASRAVSTVVATVINYRAINRWTVPTRTRDRRCQVLYNTRISSFDVKSRIREKEDSRRRARFKEPGYASGFLSVTVRTVFRSLNLKIWQCRSCEIFETFFSFFFFASRGEAKFPPPGPDEWIISSWSIARPSESRKRSLRSLIVQLVSRSNSMAATLEARRRWPSLHRIGLRWFRLGGGRFLLRLQENECRRLRFQVALLRLHDEKLDLVAIAARKRLGD